MKNLVATSLICVALVGRAQAQAAPRSEGEKVDAEHGAAPERDAGSAQPAGAPSQADIDAALARHAHEPSAQQVVQAALRATPAGRARALASRARTAAWVPRLSLRVRRGQTVDLTSPQAIDPTTLRLRTNDAVTLEAALSFDLERVIFRREEISLLSQERAERQARQRVARQVIALYFERRRLQLERDLGTPADPARSVRIAEIDALLDAFTNGAFRRMIARHRWTTGASTPASTSRSTPKSSSAARPAPARPETSLKEGWR